MSNRPVLDDYLRTARMGDRRLEVLAALVDEAVNPNPYALSGALGIPVDIVRRDLLDLADGVEWLRYEDDRAVVVSPDRLSAFAKEADRRVQGDRQSIRLTALCRR